MATERLFDLCPLFDRLNADELGPLAAGLGLAIEAGQTVSFDLLKAIGMALDAKGVPLAEMDRSFIEALNTAKPRRRPPPAA